MKSSIRDNMGPSDQSRSHHQQVESSTLEVQQGNPKGRNGTAGHALVRTPYPAPYGAKSLSEATYQYIVQHHRALTTVLIAAARIMERVDESLLPAVYLYVACSFGATPAQLGSITFLRALVQALASPLGGVLGHYFNRAKLIAVAATTWAFFTFLFARTTSVQQAMAVWAFNGIGLAVMIPNSQSLVADYYPAEQRGRAFGMLLAVGNFGSMISVVFATNMGGHSFGGVDGWRVAFYGVAAFSMIMAAAIWLLGADPRCAHRSWRPIPLHPAARLGPLYTLEAMEEEDPLEPCLDQGVGTSAAVNSSSSNNGALGSSGSSSKKAEVKELLREIWVVITTPSFLVIIAQGIIGSTPWTAMAFSALFFQLQGWSDSMVSVVLAVFNAFDAAGAFFGGWVGDWAAGKYPNHGRIIACQFSVGIGVPLSIMIFKGLPLGSAVAVYAVTYAAMGMLISWAATACNNPVMAEVVPQHLRTLVYAFDRFAEGALSALGAPLVGLAAQRLFHFEGVAATADCKAGSQPSSHHEPDFAKASALGSALALFTAGPWLLATLVYCLLHITYPRDKKRSGCTGAPLHDVAFSPLAVEEALEGPFEDPPRFDTGRVF